MASHIERCVGAKINVSTKIMDRLVTSEIKDPILIRIFSRMSEDEIGLVARRDETIRRLMKAKAYKLNDPTLDDQVQHYGRLLGRLLLTAQDIRLSPDKFDLFEEVSQAQKPLITNVDSMFHPSLVNIVIKACQVLGSSDKKSNFNHYSVPDDAKRLLLKSFKMLSDLASEENDVDKIDIIKRFEICWNNRWEDQSARKITNSKHIYHMRKSVLKIPTTEDVTTLVTYLKEQRAILRKSLSKEFSKENYMDLLELTAISLMIFNRRRHRENQKIKLGQYQNHFKRFEDGMMQNYYDELNILERKFVAKYGRVEVIGKKGVKITYILFDDESIIDMDLLIKFRSEAGVHEENEFLFAVPGSEPDTDVLNTQTKLLRWAKAAGCKEPHLIGATALRRHLATICMGLKLTKEQQQALMKQQNHSQKVHENFYELAGCSKQLLDVAKILLRAQGANFEEIADGVKLVEESDDDDENDSNNTETNANGLDQCLESEMYEQSLESKIRKQSLEPEIHEQSPTTLDSTIASSYEAPPKLKMRRKTSSTKGLLINYSNNFCNTIIRSLSERTIKEPGICCVTRC